MKTWEAVKALTENPELAFKRVGMPYIVKTELMCGLHGLVDENNETFTVVVEDEWELIPQPVSFMEAANSGKNIKHIGWVHFYSLSDALHMLGNHTNQQIIDRINEKCWLIEA